MRAVQITRFGGPEVMDVVDPPDPVPGSLALIGLTTPGRRFSTKQVTAHGRASGWSNACGESVS